MSIPREGGEGKREVKGTKASRKSQTANEALIPNWRRHTMKETFAVSSTCSRWRLLALLPLLLPVSRGGPAGSLFLLPSFSSVPSVVSTRRGTRPHCVPGRSGKEETRSLSPSSSRENREDGIRLTAVSGIGRTPATTTTTTRRKEPIIQIRRRSHRHPPRAPPLPLLRRRRRQRRIGSNSKRRGGSDSTWGM